MLTGHVEDGQTDIVITAAPPSMYVVIGVSYKHSTLAQGSNPCPPSWANEILVRVFPSEPGLAGERQGEIEECLL